MKNRTAQTISNESYRDRWHSNQLIPRETFMSHRCDEREAEHMSPLFATYIFDATTLTQPRVVRNEAPVGKFPFAVMALLCAVPLWSAEGDALSILANIIARHLPYGAVLDPIF